MKNYVNPELKVIILATDDILTMSGQDNGDAALIDYDSLFSNT